MRELKDILDIPCKLFCRDANTDISFEGVLVHQKQTVVFLGHTELGFRCLDMDNFHLTLWGSVGATPITLLNTHIITDGPIFDTDDGKNNFMNFLPAEIIIGRSYQCSEDKISIKKYLQIFRHSIKCSHLSQ